MRESVLRLGYRATLILALAAVLGYLHPPAGAQPSHQSRVHRVMIVSVDGLRPDVLLRARAPVVRGLMARGSFTLWARTTPASVTLPSHVSMLTGASPAAHGVEWNSDPPPGRSVYPARPTLFAVAKRAGLSTAMVAGKRKLSVLAPPGTLDWFCVPQASSLSDSAVTDTAVRWIVTHQPQVLFVHLPDVDRIGHAAGYGSHEQLEAVAAADRCVGRLLAALAGSGLLDSTVVFVTSDHGGSGKSHGPDDPRSRHIPWIVAGPGIRRDLDLTTIADLDVRTEDTFATACLLLGLELAPGLDGHPVTQIRE